MDFEWDPAKRAANLLKHGVDFRSAEEFFSNEIVVLTDNRRDYGEKRFTSIGLIKGRMMIVVFTRKGDKYRIISMRKANEREKKRFKDRLGSHRRDDR